MTFLNKKKCDRNNEIADKYLLLLDEHIADIMCGREMDMMKLRDIAAKLYISQKHLTAVVQQTLHHSPCYFYDQKILQQAKQLLTETDYSVAEIARMLTYDPSNFTKFFKKLSGETPVGYRLKAQN